MFTNQPAHTSSIAVPALRRAGLPPVAVAGTSGPHASRWALRDTWSARDAGLRQGTRFLLSVAAASLALAFVPGAHTVALLCVGLLLPAVGLLGVRSLRPWLFHRTCEAAGVGLEEARALWDESDT